MVHLLLAFIHIVVCIVLVFFILIQSNKGMGLAGAFGSVGASDSVFGASTGGFNIMVKITIGLSLIFTFTCCSLSFIPHGSSTTTSTSVVDKAEEAGSIKDLINASKAGAGAQNAQLPSGQQPIPAQQQSAPQQQPAPKQ